MIKWTGVMKGRAMIGLGLEERNLEKLRAGMPIHIKKEDMGIEWDILIYYGKDAETLIEMSKGGISPDTVIHDKR